MKGLVAGKSEIDKSFKMFVVYSEHESYSSVFSPIFKSHGLGFLIPGKKQMYIDGESLEDLTYDHLLAIQAHEIAHYKLKHKGQYSEKQELEADVEGYKTLIDGNYTEAARILRQRIEDHYGQKGIKMLDENKNMKFIKSFKVFEHQGTGDSTGEDERLYKIRNFGGSIKDFDDYWKDAFGETNPYKDTIMINGPHKGEKDNSLPYQDFQNSKSDLVNNRYGK